MNSDERKPRESGTERRIGSERFDIDRRRVGETISHVDDRRTYLSDSTDIRILRVLINLESSGQKASAGRVLEELSWFRGKLPGVRRVQEIIRRYRPAMEESQVDNQVPPLTEGWPVDPKHIKVLADLDAQSSRSHRVSPSAKSWTHRQIDIAIRLSDLIEPLLVKAAGISYSTLNIKEAIIDEVAMRMRISEISGIPVPLTDIYAFLIEPQIISPNPISLPNRQDDFVWDPPSARSLLYAREPISSDLIIQLINHAGLFAHLCEKLDFYEEDRFFHFYADTSTEARAPMLHPEANVKDIEAEEQAFDRDQERTAQEAVGVYIRCYEIIENLRLFQKQSGVWTYSSLYEDSVGQAIRWAQELLDYLWDNEIGEIPPNPKDGEKYLRLFDYPSKPEKWVFDSGHEPLQEVVDYLEWTETQTSTNDLSSGKTYSDQVTKYGDLSEKIDEIKRHYYRGRLSEKQILQLEATPGWSW